MEARSIPQVIDTFAEAFDMRFARLIVTAFDEHWLGAAVDAVSGYGSSVIACDAEVGVERWLSPSETPDGRIGASLLFFGFSAASLGKAVMQRVGQTVMTCPTTAVFDGLPESETRQPLGKTLRFFGDGFQKSKVVGSIRYWRIPVMDGEFLVVEDIGVGRGIGGGNLILQWREQHQGLTAMRRIVDAIAELPGVITPFPGGVARSGSKVGSRYPSLIASTAHAYCPTLRGRVESTLCDGANGCYEVVIDGVDRIAVAQAMQRGIEIGLQMEVLAIGAGNYGGKLGKHLFPLLELQAPMS